MWENFTGTGLYGVPQSTPPAAHLDTSPGIATVAGPAAHDTAALWSPQHPLFVFAVLLAAGAGLIGFAGSARVGPAKSSVHLGKT